MPSKRISMNATGMRLSNRRHSGYGKSRNMRSIVARRAWGTTRQKQKTTSRLSGHASGLESGRLEIRRSFGPEIFDLLRCEEAFLSAYFLHDIRRVDKSAEQRFLQSHSFLQ